MSENRRIGRRAACLTLFGLGGSLAAGAAFAAEKKPRPGIVIARKAKTPLAFNNADFYGPDGKLDEEAAKKACLALMRYFGYPVNETIRKKLVATDFGLGRFAEVGAGIIPWVIEKEWNYSSLEVFLLPGQMIPEHWHVAVEAEGVKAKMESWIVRYGSTFAYGEGEPTPNPAVKVHPIEEKYVTVRHEQPLRPGDVAGVPKPLEKHWQQAGPEGCILTEVSTYHTGAAVRFTDPRIKF